MAGRGDWMRQGAQDAANNINQASIASADRDAKLRDLIKGKQMDQANSMANRAADEAAQGREYEKVKADTVGLAQSGRTAHGMYGKSSFSVGDKPPATAQMTRVDDAAARDVSKRYEKMADFDSAIRDLDGATDSDGKGGVLSNPNAQIKGTGKVQSALPTGLLGLGELIHAPGIEQGTSDQRKAMERIQLQYQKATAGMRQTNEIRAAERAAMGMMASGDPQLAAKGVRALARNIGAHYADIQRGVRPEVLERVHSVSGNPLDRYNAVYNDNTGARPATPPRAPQGAAPSAGLGTPPDTKPEIGGFWSDADDAAQDEEKSERAELDALRAKHKKGN